MIGLEGSGAIFGRAETALDGTFLFSAQTVGDEGQQLSVMASDFQGKAWHAIMGLSELDDLRDEVGIGKTLAEFVRYLREALSSDSVRMAPVGSSSCHSADAVKFIAQKAKGAPLISFTLRKVTSSTEAGRLIAGYATSLFEGYRQLRNDLDRERTRASEQSNNLVKMRAKVDTLEMQLKVGASLGLSPGQGRQRRPRSPSPPRHTPAQPSPSMMLPTQSLFDTGGTATAVLEEYVVSQAIVPQTQAAAGVRPEETGGGEGTTKGKKRPAMVSKRVRSRGTKISTADDDGE